MIARIRPAAADTDAYGDPVDSDDEDVLELPGAFTAPRTTDALDEDRGRAGVVVGLTLYSPDTEADLQPTDLVDVDGVRYRLEGEPGVWRHPSGWRAGITAALVRATG